MNPFPVKQASAILQPMSVLNVCHPKAAQRLKNRFAAKMRALPVMQHMPVIPENVMKKPENAWNV